MRVTDDRVPDDRVTVVEAGRSGSGAGLIGGIIGALIIVGLLIYFIGIPALDGGSRTADIDVNLPKVEAPAAPQAPGNQ